MNIQLEIPTNIVTAVKCFSAVNDRREYIKGINISVKPDELRLSATTGHIGAIYRFKTETVIDAPMDYLIPIDLFGHIKGAGVVLITIGTDDISGMVEGVRAVTVSCNGIHMSGRTSEHKFPDLANFTPKTVSGETAQFDTALIKVLASAFKALKPRSKVAGFTIGHNGDRGALIDMGDENMASIIMPWRVENVPTARPEWV